jgi:acyl-homoserine lactone acylase PvdQ
MDMARFSTAWAPRRAAHGISRVALCLLIGGLLAALGAVASSAYANEPEDFSGGAYQILAPGDGGAPPFGPELLPTVPSSTVDQGTLYDALTPLGGNVTQANLETLYLSEKFGVTGPILGEEPTASLLAQLGGLGTGLVIKRDQNNIPHISGATRAQVMFGSGWVAAKDRGVLLKQAVGPAFAATLDIPGINPFGLLLQGREFTPTAQTEEFVNAQKAELIQKGPQGIQVLEDLEYWAGGVNAFEAAFGSHLPPQLRVPHLTATNAIAGFALIGSIFGNGGGNEVTNSNFLAKLTAQLGPKQGPKTFSDLRAVNDPEAPTTTSKPFPYDGEPTGPTPGAAVIDPGSVSASVMQAANATKASRRKASNFLLAGSEHAADGHPMAVMGPQLGYFYPEIVMQGELHGGGVDAQGIIAPISPYVFIGRGKDFAWSLTSAGSENTQQFLEQLCNPDGSPPTRSSTSYVYKGQCIPMVHFNAGTLAKGPHGEPEEQLEFNETVHGPVSGTVTVGGKPYAVANDRSTRGHEPGGELAFSKMDSNRVHSPEQFFEAANELGTTFNLPYVDSTHIAYFSTGRLPILAPGTNPSLPTLGNGEYDWRGFLSLEQHPHEVAPKSDIFTNWNNKPAPEWGAASDNYNYGPVHRVQLYTGFKSGMTEADDASIMNRAATQDLRAVKDWPLIKQALEATPAPSKLAQAAANLVSTWAESGASRFGVTGPENPGAAVLDQAWNGIGEAVLGPKLGPLLSEFASISGPNNAPSSSGSAFGGGWYGYVNKDLRSELNLPVQAPYSIRYCGNGKLSRCSESLWAAVQTAAEQLEKSQGSVPANWRAARVRIEFPPLPKSEFPFTMAWTNRSTFQQVIEFTGHAPE